MDRSGSSLVLERLIVYLTMVLSSILKVEQTLVILQVGISIIVVVVNVGTYIIVGLDDMLMEKPVIDVLFSDRRGLKVLQVVGV